MLFIHSLAGAKHGLGDHSDPKSVAKAPRVEGILLTPAEFTDYLTVNGHRQHGMLRVDRTEVDKIIKKATESDEHHLFLSEARGIGTTELLEQIGQRLALNKKQVLVAQSPRALDEWFELHDQDIISQQPKYLLVAMVQQSIYSHAVAYFANRTYPGREKPVTIFAGIPHIGATSVLFTTRFDITELMLSEKELLQPSMECMESKRLSVGELKSQV